MCNTTLYVPYLLRYQGGGPNPPPPPIYIRQKTANQDRVKIPIKVYFLPNVGHKAFASAYCELYTLTIYSSMHNQLMRTLFDGQPVLTLQ
jgi:hypothetical protein